MAEIICVIGNKGGTGKTTCSHMLGQGLGLLGYRAVVVLTDIDRALLSKANRRYLTADARTAELLAKVTDKLHGLNGWIGVIDGGGSRTEHDAKLYSLANLVLLPFRDSHEDIRTVVRDLGRFPNSYAIPSQWPTNHWQRESAERAVAQFLSDCRDRLLDPIVSISSSKLLLQEALPDDVPTALSNTCRSVAAQVLERLGLPMHAQQAL